MHSHGNIIKLLISGLILCTFFVACSADPSREIDIETVPAAVERVEVEQDNSAPAFEEVLPDSGLMENVNPEEIITDDWNSESPDAQADED